MSALRSAGVATCSRPKPKSTLSRVTVAEDQSMTACERTNSLRLPGLPVGAPAIVHGPSPVSKPSASTVPPVVVNRVSSMKRPVPPVNGSLT